jgi:hypothetical protein
MFFCFVKDGHRVDRVLGFISSRLNWDPQPPHPQAMCPPPPLWFQGGDTLAGEGVGTGEGSHSDEGADPVLV